MRFFGLLLVFLCFRFTAFATWSIIMVDYKTGEIGIAGASCTYNCYGIGKIIPGKGAVVVQAMSNKNARQKGIEMILTDASPDEIMTALRNPEFDPERQQYAVISLKHTQSVANYTGNLTNSYKGSLIARGISVQGNTLANQNELQVILEAVIKAQKEALSLAEILMLALEAGSTAGGDKRCGEQRAASAFIMVAKPHDKRPYLVLQFFGQKPGGMNAVTLLRGKYEKWKRKHIR